MATPLDPDTLARELASLPGWSFEHHHLTRAFRFRDFSEALAFILRVGLLAEKLDHHPILHNVYNRVDLALTTHDAGNRVTARDLALAQAISALVP